MENPGLLWKGGDRQRAHPRNQMHWVELSCCCLLCPETAVKCVRLGRNVWGIKEVLRWLPLSAKLSCASQHLAALLLKADLFLHLVTKIIISGAHQEGVGGVLNFR